MDGLLELENESLDEDAGTGTVGGKAVFWGVRNGLRGPDL